MMKYLLALMIAFAAIGIASSQDLVKYNDPIAKDLSNLTLSEIRAIFAGDGQWFGDGGSSIGTASQRGVLNIGDGGKIPSNYVPKKSAFMGAIQFVDDPRGGI